MGIRFGSPALVALAACALLALALVIVPGGVAEAQAQAQPTATVAEEPLLPPLALFLVRPSPELALILSSLKLNEEQGQGMALVLTEETQLLRQAAARGTLALDAGPIGQNTWRRLQSEVLSPEQYATLRDWAVANRRQALQTLQEAATGAAPMATPLPVVSGTPTAPPEIQSLVATAQAPARNGTPASGAAVVSAGGTAVAGVAVVAGTPVAAVVRAPAAATTAPTTVPTTAPITVPTTAPTAVPTTVPTAVATTVPAASATPTAAAASSVAATATATGGRAAGSITVIGQGRAVATPNVARVTLGVEATADTVRQAATEANTKTAAIIARLKSLGVADKDIQTSQYSIFPVREGGGPVAAAAGAPAATATPKPQFRVSSTVNVTLRDLNAVGPAIDGAIEAGANVAGGIQFSVDDPTPPMDQARGDAVADARRQAQQIAQAAGVTLGPPRVITEVIGSAAPQMDLAAGVARAMPAAAPPPVQGGELTFTEQIQITYEMWP